MNSFNKISDLFEPITLEKMDSVKMMDRVDTKFVFSSKLLPDILEKIISDYYILVVNGYRNFSYKSLYFDTFRDKLYLDHHNGKMNRYKVRFREYDSTQVSFLEIKYKTKNGRTIKDRIETNGIELNLSIDSKKFIEDNTPLVADQLEPKILTLFNRITLVNKALTERITLDYNLNFEFNGYKAALSNLAIAEIKRDGAFANSVLEKLFIHDYGIAPNNMSKYCIGRILLDNKLKYNNFKPRLLTINKIINDA
ncbi:MAG: polyphosphate polymerase domain-containing protein [Bacteroidales bacterium]|nr:polyphosphate polymerase domain-containing protein [Bacteroidales bacterium]